jgi:hypothetical protein
MAQPTVDQEVRRLTEQREAALARLRTLTNVGRVLMLLLVVVFVGYLAALYGKVTTMYAPENFEAPLQEEAQTLLPKLEPELQHLWSEIAPVYGELALEKFEEALPEVRESSRREPEALTANVASHAEDQVNAALLRIYRRNRERLASEFPRLSTDEGAHELGMQWMEAVEDDLEQVVVHLQTRYSKDLGELAATLDQFRPNDFDDLSEEQLARQFAHLWLMKLDHWVLGDEASVAMEAAHHER